MSRMLGVAPYFFVADVEKAAGFYRDVLGFGHERIWNGVFCMAKRDGLIVMLLEQKDKARILPNGADGESWDAYFWVTDADALFAEFSGKGARVVYGPCDQVYGNREFAIKDLDGYVLAFGHDIASREREKKRLNPVP